ncbi:hypothetical protein J6590_017620 [Homalodisca vitripennis]|nr:hypothetical protein J6590_017620 [Homalodisca vitripennis]
MKKLILYNPTGIQREKCCFCRKMNEGRTEQINKWQRLETRGAAVARPEMKIWENRGRADIELIWTRKWRIASCCGLHEPVYY